jgi:hypothetical protein
MLTIYYKNFHYLQTDRQVIESTPESDPALEGTQRSATVYYYTSYIDNHK